MPTVELRISPHSAQVRTARLLCVLLGRRSGLQDPVLEEVRLAVGEACSRAVRLHQRAAPQTFVRIEVLDDRAFEVAVTDAGEAEQAVVAELSEVPDAARDGELVAGMSLALIQGLVEDVRVEPGPGGTTVRMRWPTDAAAGAGRPGPADRQSAGP
jgi:serine/threonine-protein kinase RsbW